MIGLQAGVAGVDAEPMVTRSSEAPVPRAAASPLPVRELIARLVELARSRTGMDLAWVSSFHEGRQVFDVLAGDAGRFGLAAGDSGLLADSYCARVVDGRLPNLVTDARTHPVTAGLAATDELGIGSYIGVPIPGPDAEPLGMLCCVSTSPNATAGAPEVRFLELLAAAIAELASDSGTETDRHRRIRDRVGRVLRGGHLHSAYQPIVDLQSARIIGAEALARFPAEPRRPDLWFADAESVGLGIALELAAVRAAISRLDEIPAGIYLSVNASPALLGHHELIDLLSSVDTERVVVELTEHTAVDDYEILSTAIDALRRRGARLAIDDVGAGFSSFQHVIRLRPDIIKLDITITRGIDTDLARRGLARGLLGVAHDLGATVVAEGVETQGELDTLVNLGVDAAQGFLLARPGPLPLPEPAARPTPRPIASDERVGNETDALAFLARTWFNANDLETITRPLLDAVLERTGLETSYLTVRDLGIGALEHRYVRNAGAIDLPEGLVVPWEDTLCKRCRDAGINWTADVPADLPGCAAADAFGIQTFLSIPFYSNDGTEIGTLCAASTQARYLGAATIAEIELMARLIADRHQG
jgi:EAL domain-containing protein (putative c-di-GMP-specific phosphodiesterase class I)